MDESTLSTLGMLEEITWMLRKIGWTTFVNLKNPAYERITIEFLIFVIIKILQGKNYIKGWVTFRFVGLYIFFSYGLYS